MPARGGDVIKIYLAHRSMPGAAYTTITSSLLAETLADTVIGPLVLLAAYASGRIPHLPALGHLAAFEWSFFASHAQWFALVLAAILILIGVFFTYLEHHVVSFWTRVSLGLAILRTPRRYFRNVVSLQVAGWALRALAMYFFLQAFRIPADLVDATLALSAQSASTLLPLTPGGLGTQQALLGYMFRNAAPGEHGARVLGRHAVRDHAHERPVRRSGDLDHAEAASVARSPPRRRQPGRDPLIPPAACKRASTPPTHDNAGYVK